MPTEAHEVVVHADDLGMHPAGNAAFFHLYEKRAVTSGSVMVPCAHFGEVADWSARRAREGRPADVGIHLTLTSEWGAYRWGPVSGAENVPTLVGPDGHFYPDVNTVMAKASAHDVRMEIRAQVVRALASGMRPTHLDSHMGVLLHAKFYAEYVRVAVEFNLRPFAAEPLPNSRRGHWFFNVAEENARLAAAGFPIFTSFDPYSLDADPERTAAKRLSRLAPGTSFVIFHPFMPDCRQGPVLPDADLRRAEFDQLDARPVTMTADGLAVAKVGMAC